MSLHQVMGGMQTMNDLVFLQVKGRSQLAKEMEEMKHLVDAKEVIYYQNALNKPDEMSLINSKNFGKPRKDKFKDQKSILVSSQDVTMSDGFAAGASSNMRSPTKEEIVIPDTHPLDNDEYID